MDNVGSPSCQDISCSSITLKPLSKIWPYLFGGSIVTQGILLIYAGQLPWSWSLPIMLIFLSAGHYIRIYFQNEERSLRWSLIWAMVAFGNIGMILGWMADFGFAPLIREGACLCGCPDSPLGKGLIAKFGWMYKGMILASLPTFWIIRPINTNASRFSFEIIHIIACLGSMLTGMFLACKFLAHIPVADPYLHFIYTYCAMTLGMTLAMILPCKIWENFIKFINNRSICC